MLYNDLLDRCLQIGHNCKELSNISLTCIWKGHYINISNIATLSVLSCCLLRELKYFKAIYFVYLPRAWPIQLQSCPYDLTLGRLQPADSWSPSGHFSIPGSKNHHHHHHHHHHHIITEILNLSMNTENNFHTDR